MHAGRASIVTRTVGYEVAGCIEQDLDALHEAAGADTQIFAVTSVPDQKKGEQLAVLHTFDENAIPEILEKLTATGLPNLFVPRRDYFVKVEAIPVLGTGKLDLRNLKRVALEKLGLKA